MVSGPASALSAAPAEPGCTRSLHWSSAPSWRTLTDPRQAGPRRDVNGFVVNGSAPELFTVMSLVKKEFTRREIEERRAFGRGGATFCNILKKRDILFLTNCPLNLI
jgi:hypothetical protein